MEPLYLLLIPLIGLLIIVFVAAHDLRIKTEKVEIRVIETSYSFKDSLWYKCQFRQKGCILWQDFVKFSSLYKKISEVAHNNTGYFNRFREYNTYQKCVDFNNKAYEELRKFREERNKNRNARIL